MSSNEMPELGSRITLVSKADIRYEGKLFSVDPQDCTIALASVRSFGTEDRDTPHPVPAQSQVYDYILFRATDIKDISVIPPQQIVYDPAILQLSAPPNLESSRGYSSSQSSSGGYNHPIIGMGSGGSGGTAFQTGPHSSFNPMHSSGLGPRSHPPSELRSTSNTSDLLTASRSSTPGLRRVSPSVDQSIQAEINIPRDKSSRSQQQVRVGNNQPQFQHRNNQQTNNRTREGFQRFSGNQNGFISKYRIPAYRQSGFGNTGQQHGIGMGGKWGGGVGASGGNFGGRGGGPGGSGGTGGRGTGIQQQPPSMIIHRNNQRRNNFPRAPGGSVGPKKPLKFDTDYDFDKANTEFEELRVELAKIKIGAPPEEGHAAQNGETEKKDDSGNETAVGEGEHEETEVYYDKAKSFFDNISCEAIERSKGRSQRTDWRKERKLNSETFGVAMARRQSGYRGGRGGGSGYYSGRGGGGGYYGNRGNMRGYRQQQNNNKQRQQGQQQIPQVNLEIAKA